MPEEYFAINHSMSRRTPSTMDSAGILAEVAALNGAKGTITLGTGTWRIDLATTIPANARLVVEQGATLTKSGSGTLTINGPFEAPLAQVFSGFAAGDVRFEGYIPSVQVVWFGADASGVNDSTASIQEAIDAVVGTYAKTVFFQPGIYKVLGTVTVSTAGVLLSGEHWRKVYIDAAPVNSNTDCIVFGYATPYAKGNQLEGISLGASTTNVRRLLSVVNQHSFTCKSVSIDGGSNRGSTGIYVDYCVNVDFQEVIVQNFLKTGASGIEVAASSTTSTRFRNSCYVGSCGSGFLLNGGDVGILDSTVESNDYGIRVSDSIAATVTVRDSHFENHTYGSVYVGVPPVASGTYTTIISRGNRYLGGPYGTPAAQIDAVRAVVNSDSDSWSGSTYLIRLNRGGTSEFNAFATIHALRTPFNYPDVVKFVKDDAPVASGTAMRAHRFCGQMSGQPAYHKEAAGATTAGGNMAPYMLSDGGGRILLDHSVNVVAPVNSAGTGQATEIVNGRRYQFVFIQGTAGGKDVTFDAAVYRLATSVPSGASATSGQRLIVWFRYDADYGLWYQDTQFLGWF